MYDHEYLTPYYQLVRLEEATWNDKLSRSALRAVRRHPGHLLTNAVRSVGRWFEITPRANNHAEFIDGRNLDVRRWTLPTFCVITVLGIAGIGMSFRRDRHQPRSRLGLVVLAAIAGYFTMASVLVVAVLRLRAPFDLVCCIGVGLAAEALARREDAAPNGQQNSQSGRHVPVEVA